MSGIIGQSILLARGGGDNMNFTHNALAEGGASNRAGRIYGHDA